MGTLPQTTVATTLFTAIRRFAAHFLEMCVVMCMGGAVLNLAIFGAIGAIAGADIAKTSPELAIVIVALDLALAMAVYMSVRGHPVRHNIEMSGSTIVAAVAFIAALWAGMLPRSELQSWFSVFAVMCGPICALMLVVMLVRFDHYAGRIHSGVAHAYAADGEFTCPMHPQVRLPRAGTCPECGMRLVRRGA